MSTNAEDKKPKKAKRAAKRAYTCTLCGSKEHRATYHEQSALAAESDKALRSLVPPDVALLIVLNDQVNAAITGALRGQSLAPKSSTSLITAYTRLAERAGMVDARKMAAARRAWDELQRAQTAYDKAIEPIKDVIMPRMG